MPRRARARAISALRWLNAAFLVLAACRALVPGLCATQAAADEAAACRAAHACCAAARETHAGAASVRATTGPHAACGFCALMHGLLDSLERVVFPLSALAPARVNAAPLPALLATLPAPYHGRAPPRG